MEELKMENKKLKENNIDNKYGIWCQNRYMDTFYERVYNGLCTLI